MFSLKDKVAVVTGASQGIGRDTAKALAEAGAKVVVAARNEEKLAALVGEIVSAGGEALAVKMDVADAEQVKAGFKQVVEKFGRLDILVNNAAVTRDGLAMRMKKEDWEAVLQTNLTGAHSASPADDDEGAGWADYQYFFGSGAERERGPGELRGGEGGADRVDQGHCDRNCFAGRYRECSGAGIYCDADDGRAAGQGERRVEDADSAGTHGFGAGCGFGDCVFGER